jgi:acetyltransferase
MTVRNLGPLFRPQSVALIGASPRANSVGAVLARNLFKSGFDGPVMPVNPRHRAIEGVLTYPDVASLPIVPDLAVISTPPDAVPGIIGEIAARGTRAAVVITAGFGESQEGAGAGLQQAMLDAARPQLLRIVGPNCVGIIVPGIGLNASFAQLTPRPGRLAFVAQSGAVVTSVIDWAESRGIGFSHLVSLGDMADVDFGDTLDYLASDPDTRAILLYIEAITSARKFMSAARAAARMKPVIAVKAGRFAEGAAAARSHTGALAGVDAVYDGAFRRAGILRVHALEDLFDAAETLGMIDPPLGERLCIVTNGGGVGVLATDALVEHGGRLAQLAPETVAALDKALPRTWSHGNPVDLIGDATAGRYRDALQLVAADPGVDAVLVLNCPVAVASSTDAAAAVIDAMAGRRRPVLFTNWLGEGSAAAARRMFAEHQVPTYDTPNQAVAAFMRGVDYRRLQTMLMETPPSVPEDFTPDVAAARAVIDRNLAAGQTWLSEPDAKQVLAAYGIAVAPTHKAADPEAAAAIAAGMAAPVALKILSPDVLHKSDIGGVALDLLGPAGVRDAATAMREHVLRALPRARIEGFTVQPMIHRPGAFELIIGVSQDPQFGTIILFGHGGTAAEVIDDKALALPPLNMHLAREAMARTRIYRLLQGVRGAAPVNLDAVAMTLVRVSQMVIDLGAVEELDINPLLADEHGVIALDARIRIAEVPRSPVSRLAIRPYPKELETSIPLGDGRTLLLRPIVPEDEPSLQAGFAKLSPEEVRMRFFVPLKTLDHLRAARFTQIDYDREMALVLTEPGIPGTTDIYGVVNIIADPDNEKAEFAVIVRGDMTGMGLGMILVRRIIDYARGRGIGEIIGDVLRENTTMLRMCRLLGFEVRSVPDEAGLMRVHLKL